MATEAFGLILYERDDDRWQDGWRYALQVITDSVGDGLLTVGYSLKDRRIAVGTWIARTRYRVLAEFGDLPHVLTMSFVASVGTLPPVCDQISLVPERRRVTPVWTRGDRLGGYTRSSQSTTFSQANLRLLPIARLVQLGRLAGLESTLPDLSTEDAVELEEWSRVFPRPSAEESGPRVLTPEHYEEAARVYRGAWDAELRPTRAVAEHFGVSRTTASHYIAECRKRGLLGATRPGQQGEETRQRRGDPS